MSPSELLKAAAEQTGKHPATLETMLRHARWDAAKLAQEFKLEGWLARLEEVLIAAYVERSVRRIGPPGAAELGDDRCQELISPKLRKALVAYQGRSALILGRTGIGKTLTARLMARKLGRRLARESILKEKHHLEYPDSYPATSVSISWHAATDLALTVARHPLGKGAPDEVREARASGLLVLDDITWPQRDDTTLEVLGARYDAGKPTIVTAGCSRTELVARFGDAVVRRLLECRGVKGLLVEE
jgi:hypothetical protein